MPAAEAATLPPPETAAALSTPEAAAALRAVRALLAAERAHAARTFPPSDSAWRLLLALYEADLQGRALTAAEAADAAAVSPALAPAIAENFKSQDFLAPDEAGPLRLTAHARGHLSAWVDALTPLPGQDRSRPNRREP